MTPPVTLISTGSVSPILTRSFVVSIVKITKPKGSTACNFVVDPVPEMKTGPLKFDLLVIMMFDALMIDKLEFPVTLI